MIAKALLAAALIAVLSHNAASQTTANVMPNTFFHFPLTSAYSPVTNTTRDVRFKVVEAGFPSLPAWLHFDHAKNILFGLLPAQQKAESMPLSVVGYTGGKTPKITPLTLALQEQQGEAPTSTLRLHITNYNSSDFIANQYGNFLGLLRLLPSRLGMTDGKPFFVYNVTEGEPTPRNRPPSDFNPPINPPNNWVNRTAFVFISTLSKNFPSCSAVRSVGNLFTFNGNNFQINWNNCSVFAVPQPGDTQSSVTLRSVKPISWKRSTRAFDRTVLPAAVIAGILLILTILYLLYRWCVAPTKAQRELQQ